MDTSILRIELSGISTASSKLSSGRILGSNLPPTECKNALPSLELPSAQKVISSLKDA
jgi:hypothetical protein